MTAEPQLRYGAVRTAGKGDTVTGGGQGMTARLYPSALSGGGWYVLTSDTQSSGGGYAPPPVEMLPILEELISGDTDVTVSRRLSMSPRTYSRRVAELLDYLGADTRFQAGMEVVLHGWVPVRGYAAKISESPRRSQATPR